MRAVFATIACATIISSPRADQPSIARILDAASADERVAKAALEEIAAGWKDSYAAMFVDLARFLRGPRRTASEADEIAGIIDADPSGTVTPRPPAEVAARDERGSPIRQRLLTFLERRTGRGLGQDLNRWRQWMWTLPYDPHPDYAAFKAAVYGRVDPRMRAFFPPGVPSGIRLDEIDWGGVTVNGIPPLRHPKFVAAGEAAYLKDSNIVFGLVVNGEAKAYPKRILAWHEMAADTVGGVEMTIVYCTLCGTVVPFESTAAGRSFRFGTSGLLYRSNKLMFDEQTSSLWSTFEGVPVLGPLVGSGVKLVPHPVVTTTWKEWRREHPDSRVLSVETGYARDYSEGAAYRDYFATDRLMFGVSNTDGRLKNKAEVLTFRVPVPNRRGVPVAIDTQLLRKRPVFGFTAAERRFVVLTSAAGANRVYAADVEFPDQPWATSLADASGHRWQVTESALVRADRAETKLLRVSAQRAFWFGWYAHFPDTLLIK